MKAGGKKRLNLTVQEEFKMKAAELAKAKRRSISGLFEDLIEKEALGVKKQRDVSRDRPKT